MGLSLSNINFINKFPLENYINLNTLEIVNYSNNPNNWDRLA